MEIKCGRLAITKEHPDGSLAFGTVSTESFENPVCVATLHTDGDNQNGLPYIVKVSPTKENSVRISINSITGTSVPQGTYYVDYIISEMSNATQLTVG